MAGNGLNENMKEVDRFKDFWKLDLDTNTFTLISNDLLIGKRRAPKCVVLTKNNKIKLLVYGGSDGQTKQYPQHISIFLFDNKKFNNLLDSDDIFLPN